MRVRVLHFVGFLAATQIKSLLLRRLDGFIDQISDDLVTVRRNADGSAMAHKFADHLRTRVCLARAGWSLNRQHAAGKTGAYSDGRIHCGFALSVERLSASARDLPHQQ